PKYSSNDRFSCMMTTTCWILWIPDAADEPTALSEATGAPAAAAARGVTVTVSVARPVRPPSSVDVRVAVYVPALAYVCAMFAGGWPDPWAATVPSPNARLHAMTDPPGLGS